MEIVLFYLSGLTSAITVKSLFSNYFINAIKKAIRIVLLLLLESLQSSYNLYILILLLEIGCQMYALS